MKPPLSASEEDADIRVSFSWVEAGPITLDNLGRPRFPLLPRTPGIYRLTLAPGVSARSRVYIGEAQELRRRAADYRSPGSKQTALRVHERLVSHLSNRGSVRLDVALEATVTFDGATLPLDLRQKSARQLAECAALVVARIRSTADIENLT